MNDKLLHISLTDGLTGVDNRRSLEQRLHEMFEHSLRLHEPISCVMCDIDHFKKVNDTYGHAAGDEVLKQFAEILKHEAREIDSVGRYGGEEFLLLLPGTVLDSAVTFAERLRQRVEEHTFSYEGGTLKRTVSLRCGFMAASPQIEGARSDAQGGRRCAVCCKGNGTQSRRALRQRRVQRAHRSRKTDADAAKQKQETTRAHRIRRHEPRS